MRLQVLLIAVLLLVLTMPFPLSAYTSPKADKEAYVVALEQETSPGVEETVLRKQQNSSNK